MPWYTFNLGRSLENLQFRIENNSKRPEKKNLIYGIIYWSMDNNYYFKYIIAKCDYRK